MTTIGMVRFQGSDLPLQWGTLHHWRRARPASAARTPASPHDAALREYLDNRRAEGRMKLALKVAVIVLAHVVAIGAGSLIGALP